MNNQKKSVEKNDSTGTIAAAITGAIVGAGIVAGAVALNDKTTRDKVKGALNEVKEKAGDMIESVQAKGAEKKEDLKDLTNQALDKMKSEA